MLGHQLRRRHGPRDSRRLCEALDDRAQLPRHKGHQVRHGLSLLRISRPDRRDRLLLINAFALHLLTMLGTAGEELGMDRQLRSGTSNRRTHSLFRQGCMLYDLIPNMPEVRLRPLMKRLAEVMQRSSAIQSLVAVP